MRTGTATAQPSERELHDCVHAWPVDDRGSVCLFTVSHRDAQSQGSSVGRVFSSGTDTVIRDDGTSHTFRAGDTTGESGTTVHWHRNDGKDNVVLVTADVFNTGK
jgi:hypothetical protein